MSFASDPSLFVHQMDTARDRLLLMRVTEDELRAASFLDQRLVQTPPGEAKRAMQWGDFATIAPQTDAPGAPARDDARFIFHIGHVGSTLIARLLGEAPDTLALREPQILRQFAELRMVDGLAHSPWPPGQVSDRLPLARKWLSRTFRADQRALIKATSFVSDIAGDLLEGSRKAVFLTLSPERYLQTILSGEASRQELAVLSSARLQRLNNRLHGPDINLWELDEAARAAMAWACELTALDAAANENTLWQDFDDFLAQPAQTLTRIAEHIETAVSPDQAQSWVEGPIMQRYSKAPEQGYSPQLREEVLAAAAQERRDDIASALRWLDRAAGEHPAIASAMERA
ncbi:MAG: hypothetical protein QNI87_05400 [Erythrobacter sp.]|uniref:hypothetical protein n=1 Tax=Erythrobacter sp. TaxID=1042 RepID=UPI00260D38B3|nr:hypothetical protein [Erythrobacter sp.]MDJ0977953.1 hypothetical protein [Erythrobacter sp.]